MLCPEIIFTMQQRKLLIMRIINKKTKKQMLAANEWFGCNGGRSPQKRQCGFGSLSSARTFVEPPPA